jgi:ribosomal protein S12 methylthiotransferase accessory factor
VASPAHVGRLLELVSPRVGLVKTLAPQTRGAEEPLPPYLYTATLASFDFRNADKSERVAAGKGRTESEAIASAIGEAVERYCAYHWDPRKTFVAKWSQVEREAVSPAECVLYSERQYDSPDWPYRRFSPDEEVTWLPSVELPEERNVAAPASLIYLVYPVPRPEDFFAPATSNGLAAGANLAGAILGGLHELVERDALLVTWMNRLPAIEIEFVVGGVAGSIRDHYARFGVEVRAFLMRTDLPLSVVMAVAFDSDLRRPATLIGMGCHLAPGVALDKALFELCQARPSEAKRYADDPPGERLRRYEDVRTLEDHSAFLSLPEQRREFEFLWRSGERARVADLPDPSTGCVDLDLAKCIAALVERGHRVVYTDLTTLDVAPYGIRVARTLATGLQPIHFGHGQERFGGSRLFELPQRLGFAAAPGTEADLNPCPHPLA